MFYLELNYRPRINSLAPSKESSKTEEVRLIKLKSIKRHLDHDLLTDKGGVRIDDGQRKEYTFRRATGKLRRHAMDLSVLKELKEKAKGLTPEENLDLITHLLNRVRTAGIALVGKRKWSEICGKAPYPLIGEDAQTWVTRNRKESDERRQKNWR